MNGSIPPINLPQLGNPLVDKVIGGQLENPVPELQNIKPSDVVMLKLLTETSTFSGSSLNSTVKLTINGQSRTIPLALSLDAPLELPAESEISLKFVAKNENGIQVRLVSINNESPEKFIARPEIRPSNPVASGTVINDTGQSKNTLTLTPGNLGKLTAPMMEDLPFPARVSEELGKQLARVKVGLGFNAVLSSAEERPVSQGLQNVVRDIQEQLSLLGMKEDISAGDIKATVDQIKNILVSAKSLPVLGEAAVKGDAGQLVLKTPFGDVFPEQNLKLTPGTTVLLDIKTLAAPRETVLPELIQSRDLLENLFNPASLLAPGEKHVPRENVLNAFLDVLKPLNRTQPELVQQILSKIPAPDVKMVSNLATYIKAVRSHDLSAWLGVEVMEKLSASGIEGREVLSKLSTLLTSHTQETVQWRIVEIPFYAGDNLSKIQVALKKMSDEDEKDAENNRKKYGTRFVVDTSFTKLGAFQFDGFSLEKDRRFDLIIRTEREFDEDFCSNVMRIFKKTLHDVNYNGNVYINIKENFIKVCDDKVPEEILKSGIFI